MRNISKETAEALEKFNTNINQRVPVIVSYLLLMFILKEFFLIPFPYITLFLISFMLLSSLILAFYFENFTPKAKTIINGFFLYMILDLFILTIVIYFLGGVFWIGYIFYSFYLILNFMTFPRFQAIFLTFWIIFLYLALTFSQSLEILSPKLLFSLEKQNFFNFPFVLTTTVAFVSTFILVAYYSRGFFLLYSQKIIQLGKTKDILEREKNSLEILIAEKKKELEKEKKGLEKKIEVRKKELEGKERELQERAEELEKFQTIALGREEKLKELERELKILESSNLNLK